MWLVIRLKFHIVEKNDKGDIVRSIIRKKRFFRTFFFGALLTTSLSQYAQAQINPSPVQIRGVKLGMSLDEAQTTLEKYGYAVTPLPDIVYSFTFDEGGEKEKVEFAQTTQTIIATKEDGLDTVHLSTLGHPEREGIVLIARKRNYMTPAHVKKDRPLWSDVSANTKDFFGKAHDKWERNLYQGKAIPVSNPYLAYEFNSKGKKRNGAGFKKLTGVIAMDKSQPNCSLPETAIEKGIGKRIKFFESKDLAYDYSDDYISGTAFVDNYTVHNGNTSIGYGPTAIRSQTKIKSANQNILASKLCRTVYFIRGNINRKNSEINSVMFYMMDHQAILRDKKSLIEWRNKKFQEIKKGRPTVVKNTPKIDL